VAFDIIGTMFTLDRPRERLAALGAPPQALETWFSQALRDATMWSHAGGYRPLKDFLLAALVRTLSSAGIEPDEETTTQVMQAFAELDPVDGAPEACAHLSDSGWKIIALTNGSEDLTRGLLARGGMLERFSTLVSCDRIQKTKPHPAVYEMAKQEAEGSLWLVAAHAWDVAGASRAGLRTCWIQGLEGRYLDVYPEPDVHAANIMEAAGALVERESERS
jgi:2-haloacid dehalogenase